MALQGIFPALITPFDERGEVSIPAIRRNIHLFNKTQVAGYLALGSTGETVLLRPNESMVVLETVREAAAPGKVLIAGTGAESTAETIERTKHAAVLGYDFALVKTPYYYKPVYKSEHYLRHYRAVADESPIPVLLYSVPQFTGITLETPDILALSEHPNIVGIKDSSGVIQRVAEVVSAARSDFHMLTGGAAVVYPALSIGARGAILALANALPEACAELFSLFVRGEADRAQALQLRLARASKIIVGENGIPGVKYAMDLRGYVGGVPRLPLLPPNPEQKKRLAAIVEEFAPQPA